MYQGNNIADDDGTKTADSIVDIIDDESDDVIDDDDEDLLVESVIVTFWPSTTKVFFCKFGLNTRFVRRSEKLTLWPNCLPLPVRSQRAAMVNTPRYFSNQSVLVYR